MFCPAPAAGAAVGGREQGAGSGSMQLPVLVADPGVRGPLTPTVAPTYHMPLCVQLASMERTAAPCMPMHDHRSRCYHIDMI